jgi:predicted membrane protein
MPAGGWPHHVLTELLVPHAGMGELRLLVPALSRIAGLFSAREFYIRDEDTVYTTEAPFAVFGTATMKDRSEHFEHGEVSALFGGATLDLREAHIDDEATVDATAIFGAVDVLVPEGWRVALGGLPIFGGYDDKTKSEGGFAEDAPTLNVHATAVFGGVDVAHQPS